jgi:tartrate dehydrogenase/decarboxylase/D-malate dehydrogenase
MNYSIAVIPGDGVGPEVIEAGLPVVRHAAEAVDVQLSTTIYDWGSQCYLEEGRMMPADGLDSLASHDGILLGAVGHDDIPDHITLQGLLLPIRKEFEQRICKRPAVLFDGVESPLSGYSGGDIDFTVFRENVEGEYADVGGREYRGTDSEIALQTNVFTRRGVETVVREAFEAAQERCRRLTSVTKSNAQSNSMVLWDNVVREVSNEYPTVEVERLLVDAASMALVQRPESFDVVVASNLFGDILTDVGSAVTGGVGLAPSANVCPDESSPSMFEPIHGSAPDIAGGGIANPVATVRSGEMLLRHLGESAAAERLRSAVASQLADPNAPRTPDIGGSATTEGVASDLRERIGY